MFSSDIDIISFDASQYDITMYPLYRRGRRIAWGVENKENVRDFRKGDFLTLPWKYEPSYCNEGLKKLLEISRMVSC